MPAPSAAAATAVARQISPQVAGRRDRVRRQPVHLGVVEQQEERAEAADAVVRVGAVQAGVGVAGRLERLDPRRRHARAAPSSSPNWIELVGHAFAQAGSRSSFRRS